MGSINEKGFGKENMGVGALLGIQDGGKTIGKWKVEKYNVIVHGDVAAELAGVLERDQTGAAPSV